MSEKMTPIGEFNIPAPQIEQKGPNLPPEEVVHNNLDNYPQAHKAEVQEAFNQAEREEQTQEKPDAA